MPKLKNKTKSNYYFITDTRNTQRKRTATDAIRYRKYTSKIPQDSAIQYYLQYQLGPMSWAPSEMSVLLFCLFGYSNYSPSYRFRFLLHTILCLLFHP